MKISGIGRLIGFEADSCQALSGEEAREVALSICHDQNVESHIPFEAAEQKRRMEILLNNSF